MHNLERTFLDYDLQLLRAIAEAAGVELTAGKARLAASELAGALQEREAVELLLVDLPQPAVEALAALRDQGGRAPAAAFMRRYGEVRPLGPGARERESPQLHPANPVEALWYRGLVGRAFVDEGGGPVEFFYVPTDLEPFLPQTEPPARTRPAAQIAAPTRDISPARSTLVDDACTLLAYLQCNPTPRTEEGRLPQAARSALRSYLQQPAALDLLTALSGELGWVAGDPLKLDPAAVRAFLEASRGEQLQRLVEGWRDSTAWHDVLHVPGLVFDESTGLRTDPRQSRQAILDELAFIPSGEWCSLGAFVAFMREHRADFQRPAGDYDSWYVRDARSGDYLRGFENWGLVDGATIAFLIAGPLHWLGLVDLSRQPLPDQPHIRRPGLGVDEAAAPPVTAFYLTSMFAAFNGRGRWHIPEQNQPLEVRPNGSLRVARAASRYDRFQAARVADWQPLRDREHYEYQLTANSLNRAAEQGVAQRHVTAFLLRASGRPLPPRVQQALQRWGEKGVEARLRQTLVLLVRSEAVMEQLRSHPKITRYLGAALGPLAVEVKARDWEKLQQAMMELGILLERDESA